MEDAMILKRDELIKCLEDYVEWKLTFNASKGIIESRCKNKPTNTEMFQQCASMLKKDARLIARLQKKPRDVRVIIHKARA